MTFAIAMAASIAWGCFCGSRGVRVFDDLANFLIVVVPCLTIGALMQLVDTLLAASFGGQ